MEGMFRPSVSVKDGDSNMSSNDDTATNPSVALTHSQRAFGCFSSILVSFAAIAVGKDIWYTTPHQLLVQIL